ncbi:hypothetical protein N7478_003466 [Penicillium angulare]|uniref:uncharacterized protein n=1 Tax=Penicillium angulare TaxID=116970 RepID=UPI0025406495|nr:uncharacterized protein N7478_003466 [Penicillium angulare]KAJ5287780.1 hypothetical protein N7478_003466 [Penicillium angulare]
MPSAISKRQQQRNEKALAELIRTVPGNDRCADCDALTPGWASWNMGLFLCMRCAAIHRKLGTHISKVKSLSMDTWSSEQVDSMKSHGNLLMNKIYNPKNIKPPVPTDIDEADSCMERFIRQKYQYRSLEDGKPKPPSREDSSYTRLREEPRRRGSSPQRSPSSPEGSPPPLPPKSGKFFGFGLRSSSSTSNLRRFGTKKASPSPSFDQRSWSPPPSNKTTGLGAPVADVTTDSFEAKMAALRELGFNNNRRNEMVLKGLNEDLDRSIDTLARLGEGNQALIRARKASNANKSAPPRAVSSAGPAAVSKPETTNNPFDRAVSNPVPQQTQGVHVIQSNPYNPFDQMSQTPQSAQPLEASFQGLQVSQPLFPHSTGGYPNRANSMPQPTYQQPYTPPVTSTFSNQSGYIASPQPMDNSYNPFFQTAPQPQGGMGSQSHLSPGATQNNPFFSTPAQTQSQPQQSVPSVSTLGVPHPPQHANTMPAFSSTSPFGTSPFGQAAAFQPQQPQQPQQQPQQQQQHQQPVGQVSYNPFQQSMGQPTPQSAGGQFNGYSNQFAPQQPQQLVPQTTGRMDKSGILSLYNLAPSPTNGIPPIPEHYQSQPGAGISPVPQLTNSFNSTPQSQPPSSIQTPQQNTGNPFPASNIPFPASNNPFPVSNNPFPASNNPWGGSASATGAGSGLAAQAGVTTYPSSSGLGIGMGANGSAAPAPPAPAVGMGAGIGLSASNGPSPFRSVNPALPRTHVSQPSVDINGLQNGRHSPDAFASLSSRYG